MKKLAIGCAVLLALGVVGVAGASWIAYRKVSSTVAGFSELGSLPELERSVRNQRPFTPPPSGEPSRAQVERLLEVQRAVRARLGDRAEEIERRYRRLLAKDRATAVDVPQLLSAYRDLAVAYVDGKRGQIEALNRTGLSVEEYRWVRSRTYAALGMPLIDVDVSGLIEDIRAGRSTAAPTYRVADTSTGSQVVRRMVEPHRKSLEANIGLAFFGL